MQPGTPYLSCYAFRMLEPGRPAPEFTLPDHEGNDVTLSDLRGNWVLLWWYPKASTPG